MPLIPTFNDLSFYNNPDASAPRYKNLTTTFETIYHANPQFISRSPGRVNLIGDHIDYCYFSVLPMALDKDVIIASLPNDSGVVQLHNTNNKFAPYKITLPSDGKDMIEIDQTEFTWVNYFKCGFIVAHKYIVEKHPELIPLKGIDLLFDGNVPTGGGLSSSAAICVASTLAVLRANGIKQVLKQDLTRITVVLEHYVGVNTGGMDQCASIYGEKRKALLIQFKPQLVGIPFELPVIKPYDMVFLISNSLVESNKHETAPVNYNLRVVEVAVAAEYLAKKFNLTLTKDSNLATGTLRGFLDSYFEQVKGESRWDGQNIDIGINRLQLILELIETDEIYNSKQKIGLTTEVAARELNLQPDQFHQNFLSKFPVEYKELKLYQRSKHVFSDSLRVLQFLKLLEDYKLKGGDAFEFLQKLGTVLNESQVSCNTLNNASKPGCEELCSIALAHGSYGSRITGAGFGGSIVHLTTVDRLPTLRQALIDHYYKKNFPGITQEQLNEAIVDSKPATGSCILEL